MTSFFRIAVWAIFVIPFHLATAAATEGLSLEQAILAAKEANPRLKTARSAANEASWRRLEAISGNLPHFSLDGMRLLDVRYLAMPFGPQTVEVPNPPRTSLTLNASWTIFDGLRTFHTYEAASLSEQAAQLDLERIILQIENETRLKYFQALGAQLLAEVAEQNIKTLQDHYKRTQELLTHGQATKFDLLRVKVQLSEAFPEKSSADDNAIIARRNLAQVMGLSDDPTPLVSKLAEPQRGAIPTEIRFEPQARADVQAIIDRAESSAKLHAAVLSTWLPSLTFAYQYQFYNVTSTDSVFSLPYSNAHMFMLNFTWNLFDGGASFSRQKQSFYRQQQAEAQAHALTIAAPNEFETFRRRYNTQVDLFHARKESIDTAEESLRLAKIGYEAGTRTSSDVLDAELDLFRARAGAVRAQVEAAESLFNFELALGRKL